MIRYAPGAAHDQICRAAATAVTVLLGHPKISTGHSHRFDETRFLGNGLRLVLLIVPAFGAVSPMVLNLLSLHLNGLHGSLVAIVLNVVDLGAELLDQV